MVSVVFFFFKQKTAYELRISDWSSDVCSSDLIFYRYREILFMKAEAYAMLGRYPEAEAAINVVREHCDIPPLGIGEGGEGEEFCSRLLMEREFELGFEGKEWFAAVRISRRQGYSNILVDRKSVVKGKSV